MLQKEYDERVFRYLIRPSPIPGTVEGAIEVVPAVSEVLGTLTYPIGDAGVRREQVGQMASVVTKEIALSLARIPGLGDFLEKLVSHAMTQEGATPRWVKVPTELPCMLINVGDRIIEVELTLTVRP